MQEPMKLRTVIFELPLILHCTIDTLSVEIIVKDMTFSTLGLTEFIIGV